MTRPYLLIAIVFGNMGEFGVALRQSDLSM